MAKLSDSEGEAAETQVWLKFSYHSKYIDNYTFDNLNETYEKIIGKLVTMALNPEKWRY